MAHGSFCCSLVVWFRCYFYDSGHGLFVSYGIGHGVISMARESIRSFAQEHGHIKTPCSEALSDNRENICLFVVCYCIMCFYCIAYLLLFLSFVCFVLCILSNNRENCATCLTLLV